jgi:hypothetical protein
MTEQTATGTSYKYGRLLVLPTAHMQYTKKDKPLSLTHSHTHTLTHSLAALGETSLVHISLPSFLAERWIRGVPPADHCPNRSSGGAVGVCC